MNIHRILKLILLCSISFSISSCCGLLDGMRLYDRTYSEKIYHFDLSINELASRLNKASGGYYLQSRNLSKKIEACKSSKEYTEWTQCFNEKENAYQRCGYQEMSIYDKNDGKQLDGSYHTCLTELQLIDLRKIKTVDTLEIDTDFGRIVITGNQKTSQLYTPHVVKVRKKKCLSKKKRSVRAIEQFETNIIKKIKHH
ncbi:hypothetical protein OAC51_09940 [Flavobacteriaceae bacterium]|nr:hypothetical protein [Flavobacteriaceae bacterium]